MKKNMTRYMRLMFHGLFLSVFLFGCSGEVITKFDDFTSIEGYKNVILMIGDGMGENHIKVTEAYNERPSFIRQEAQISGWMKTYSLNSDITDSAASATAMSTGLKVPNGNIAYKSGQKLTTMSEFAKAYEKGVGIIATEILSGATPAAFSAHNRSRRNSEQIVKEQFESEVDLFIGAGKSYYDLQIQAMDDNNLSYYTNFDDLSSDIDDVASGGHPFTRLFAAFDTISVNETTSTSPTLADASINAIRCLDYLYDNKGFFMMIEGSHIDKRAHDNDLQGMIDQLNGFNQAVESVVDWARHDGETLVMVTADHETGGLIYDGQSKEQLSDALFTRTTHSGVDVPFYLYSTTNLSFINQGETIDNTDVANFFRALIR